MAEIYSPGRGKVIVKSETAPLPDIGLGMDGLSTGRQNLRLRGLSDGKVR
jgi:ABC-type polysaccharide/polyol phosphate transport system ATPase subunit